MIDFGFKCYFLFDGLQVTVEGCSGTPSDTNALVITGLKDKEHIESI
jgi:hypothetical protein